MAMTGNAASSAAKATENQLAGQIEQIGECNGGGVEAAAVSTTRSSKWH